MRDYLQKVPASIPIQPENSQARSPEDPDQGEAPTNDDEPIFMGYNSDLESLADDESESLMGIREVSVDNGDDDPPTKRIRRQLEEPVLVTQLKLREE